MYIRNCYIVLALDALMPRTYRTLLQEDLYYLELYASYLHNLAVVAATVGLVVLSGTYASFLQGFGALLQYKLCSMGHSAFYVSYLQSFGTLCFLCFILTELLCCCRRFSSSCCVVWGIMFFMLHTYRASELPPLQ